MMLAGDSLTEITADQEDNASGKAVMPKMKPWMKRLWVKLKPIVKDMIRQMLDKMLAGDSLTEITAHQEEDDASGKAVMPKMKPWMKRLWVKLKPIVIETIKKMLKQMLAGDSLAEIT